MTEATDVIVVGAGFAGLYAVHRCASAGLSVTALEAAPDVGGTWYWNRYPGARCDVESVDYSYSFDEALQRSWTWSERFAAQPEILAYLRHVADRFDLRRHYRFGVDVVDATFDRGRWHVRTAAGETYAAQFLLCATGCLSAVNRPDIPGIDDFAGDAYFTAAWPREDPDLRGKRVGLIGTGSSGIQAVPIVAAQAEKPGGIPAIRELQHPDAQPPVVGRRVATDPGTVSRAAPDLGLRGGGHAARHLSQESRRHRTSRSAPKPCGSAGARAACCSPRRSPTRPATSRPTTSPGSSPRNGSGRSSPIPSSLTDLIPVDHPIGAKRICTDAGYYSTFNRANVRLVNLRREPIETITANGIRTNAATYPCDVLIFATGFDAMTGALTRIDPIGPGRERLRDIWANGPVTFLGLMVPGLPNLFTISGPGSPSVLANMVLHAEVQVDWVIDLVLTARRRGVSEVEPRRDAARAWTYHVAQAAEQTLFPKAASSWYLGSNIEGKKRVFMPYIGGFGNYRRQCDDVTRRNYAGLVLTTRYEPQPKLSRK